MMRTFLVSCLIVVLFAMGVSAQTDWDAQVTSMMEGFTQAFATEDIDAAMKYFHPDYSFILTDLNKEKMKQKYEELFRDCDEIRFEFQLKETKKIGRYLVTFHEESLYARNVKNNATEASLLTKNFVAEILVETEGKWLLFLSAIIEEKGLDKVKGNRYENQTIGISYQIPANWIALPLSHPSMMEMYFLLPPQGHSGAIYGFLELPYQATPKQAVEADENISKRVVGERFKNLSQGEIQVKGYEGYESITEFAAPGSEEFRKRRRVYFSAGGLLHVFIFDAVPASAWETDKKDFDMILDSFTMNDQRGQDAVQRARQEFGSGSAIGDVYVNEKAGCQVAAPKGWVMESTNIGGNAIFSIHMKPSADSDSLVRLIAWPHTDQIPLEKILEMQAEGYRQVAKDVVTSPTKPIQIQGMDGLCAVDEFTIESFKRFKRKTVMFIANGKLFAFLCDAIPPAEYEKLEPKFDEIIDSFTLN